MKLKRVIKYVIKQYGSVTNKQMSSTKISNIDISPFDIVNFNYFTGSTTHSITYDNTVDFKANLNSITSSNATISLQGPRQHSVILDLNGELHIHFPDGLYTFSAIDLFGNTASGTFSVPTTATVSIPQVIPDLNIKAVGGTITYANGRKIHTFSYTGIEDRFHMIDNPLGAELRRLIQAGGGSAGSAGAGGGGGGYTIYEENWLPTMGIKAIYVGRGYKRTIDDGYGHNGQDSYIDDDVALGGGGGSGPDLPTNAGLDGGNGGGAYYTGGVPGSGLQGYPGGVTTDGYWYTSSGGGGSNGPGLPGTSNVLPSPHARSGDGGPGKAVYVRGFLEYYGGGGAGGYSGYDNLGTLTIDVAVGGIGGGGSASKTGQGGDGVDGKGGGAAGGTRTDVGTFFNGGSGGNGEVVISYPWEGPPIDYDFTIEVLNEDVPILGRDSAYFFKLDDERLLLVYGWINQPGEIVTNEAYVTTDGIDFTPIADAPAAGDHLTGMIRNDGYAWFWGSRNNGDIFIHKLNPTTLEWTELTSSLTHPYVGTGFGYNNEMYILGFENADPAGTTRVYRIKNDYTLEYISTLPVLWAYNSAAYVYNGKIRIAGGAKYDEFNHNVLDNMDIVESTDGGLTWNIIGEIDENMKGLWPTYIRFNQYEIYWGGFNYVNAFSQGLSWYREIDGGLWRQMNFIDQHSNHALVGESWKNSIYTGFGSTLAEKKTYRITNSNSPKSAWLVANARAYGDANSNMTLPINSTGSKIIIISSISYSAGTDPVITDSQNNIWIPLTKTNASTAASIRLFYCVNPNISTSHTFTSSGTGSYPGIIVYCFGSDLTPIFESQSSNTSGNTFSISPGAINPTTSQNIVISAINNWQESGALANRGFTTTHNIPATPTTLAGSAAYKFDQNGSVDMFWTLGNTNVEAATTVAIFRLQ